MILASGCFDGLHAGHVAYLQGASGHRLYDRSCHEPENIVVAVACDDYIRIRKRREPVWNTTHRMSAIAALRCVDDTISHGADGVAHVIRERKPRLFVKGPDAMGFLAPDVVAACREVGCAIVFVMHAYTGKHTSDAVSAHQ